MGRYRRNKHRGRRQNRKRNDDTNGSNDVSDVSNNKPKKPLSTHAKKMTEADFILVEKYLVDYRTKAFEICNSRENDNSEAQPRLSDAGESKSYMIGSHAFEPLTVGTCSRPYIDLPDTLGPKERRYIHSSCAFLDLYHAGAGVEEDTAISVSVDEDGSLDPKPKKRRIVISIYANGFQSVPDLEFPGRKQSSPPIPRQMCRPWYYQAARAQKERQQATIISESGQSTNVGTKTRGETNSNHHIFQRIKSIEREKQQIHQFIRHPEQSIRVAPRTTNDPRHQKLDNPINQLDSLNLKQLESLDLSSVPTPQETPWMLVNSVDKLKQCVQEMGYGGDSDGTDNPGTTRLHELAFDMEMHNHGNGGFGGSSSRQPNRLELRTCLIQMTSNVTHFVSNDDDKDAPPKEVHKDYVIDPLAPGVWDAIPTYLGPIFADPNIVKIGHGIGGMDTSSLHRDFGIIVVNAFDTHEAATILSRRSSHKRFQSGLGLASLCKHYGLPSWKLYQQLKSVYQCSDWRKRPLLAEAIEYGRYDVRYLIMLRELLMRDLVLLELSDKMNTIASKSSSFSQYDSASDAEAHFSNSRLENNISNSDQGTSSFSDFGTDYAPTCSESENGVESFLNEFRDATDNYDAIIRLETDEDSDDLFFDPVTSSDPFSSPTKPEFVDAFELQRCRHLMNAVSLSHKRCLSLWKDDEEPVLRNHSLVKVMKDAALQKGHGKYWTDGHLRLYKSLAKWRKDVAHLEGMHASELCTLDFLVHVAYKLPISKWEMRRYGYILPALIEDENLPYCDELCELVVTSDVFKDQSLPPLSEMGKSEVVFYQSEEKNDNSTSRKFCKKALILLAVSATIGIVAITLTKTRRK